MTNKILKAKSLLWLLFCFLVALMIIRHENSPRRTGRRGRKSKQELIDCLTDDND